MLLALSVAPVAGRAQVMSKETVAISALTRKFAEDPVLQKLVRSIEGQQQVIVALIPSLATNADAKSVADEFAREGELLVKMLVSAAKSPPTTDAAGRQADVAFVSAFRARAERLDALQLRFASLPPTVDVAPQKSLTSTSDQKATSSDHNQTVKDAMRKMLDQIAEINRATSM